MKLELTNTKSPRRTTLQDMNVGDIAIVTDKVYTGTIITRLSTVATAAGIAFAAVSDDGKTWGPTATLEVRILTPGETLTIK